MGETYPVPSGLVVGVLSWEMGDVDLNLLKLRKSIIPWASALKVSKQRCNNTGRCSGQLLPTRTVVTSSCCCTTGMTSQLQWQPVFSMFPSLKMATGVVALLAHPRYATGFKHTSRTCALPRGCRLNCITLNSHVLNKNSPM